MKPIRKEEFERVFPNLEKIYNDKNNGFKKKTWQQTKHHVFVEEWVITDK